MGYWQSRRERPDSQVRMGSCKMWKDYRLMVTQKTNLKNDHVDKTLNPHSKRWVLTMVPLCLFGITSQKYINIGSLYEIDP